jgi:hypothetical protein
MNEGFEAKVYRNKNEFYIKVASSPADRIYPESKTLFKVKEFPATVEFVPSTDGGKMGIILSRKEEKYKGVKVD